MRRLSRKNFLCCVESSDIKAFRGVAISRSGKLRRAGEQLAESLPWSSVVCRDKMPDAGGQPQSHLPTAVDGDPMLLELRLRHRVWTHVTIAEQDVQDDASEVWSKLRAKERHYSSEEMHRTQSESHLLKNTRRYGAERT